MRINVYSQEMTQEFVSMEKYVEAEGRRYYGFRMFLDSPPILDPSPRRELLLADEGVMDRRSAITLWFPTKQSALAYFTNAARLIQEQVASPPLATEEDWQKGQGVE